MKKFFLILIAIVAIIASLFGGLHIGTACPQDAKDFAAHVQQQGHVMEWGGIDKFLGFLRGVANGTISVNIYGDATRTVIAATSSEFGPGVIIYGKGVLPTAFPTTTDRINQLTRGMTIRPGKADIGAARNTAKCFEEALQPVSVATPTTALASRAALIAVAIAVAFGGILILGSRRRMGGAVA